MATGDQSQRYNRHFLPEANLVKNVETGKAHCMSYGASCMQGWRIRQEDARCCIPEFGQGMSLFGVFDGHGGPEISNFLKLNLPLFLRHQLRRDPDVGSALRKIFMQLDGALLTPLALFAIQNIILNLESGFTVNPENSAAQSQPEDYRERAVDVPRTQNVQQQPGPSSLNTNLNTQPLSGPRSTGTQTQDSDPNDDESPLINGKDLEDGIVNIPVVLRQVDWFRELYLVSQRLYFARTQHLGRMDGPVFKSGSTANVAVLKRREGSRLVDLWVANVGDSRCVVSRCGVAKNLSTDHKPNLEIERQRIVAAGGSVGERGRVIGGINMSRSFGDYQYKRNRYLPPENQMICAVPDVCHYVLDPFRDDFVVIACDGIWNSMDSQRVVDLVNEYRDQDYTIPEICAKLCDLCTSPWRKALSRAGDGLDNTSIIIIAFDNSKIWRPAASTSASNSTSPSSSATSSDRDTPPSPLEDEGSEQLQATTDANTRPASASALSSPRRKKNNTL